MSKLHDVAAFHAKFKLAYDGPPRRLPKPLRKFRVDFLQEELDEYKEAIENNDLEKQLDALVDLVYIALGNAHIQGFNFDEAFARVHAANMSKVRTRRKADSKRGSSFDVVKPPGWKAPDLSDLV